MRMRSIEEEYEEREKRIGERRRQKQMEALLNLNGPGASPEVQINQASVRRLRRLCRKAKL